MGLSYSRMQQYMNCPLAYRFRYVIGLRLEEDKKGTESHDSTFGTAIHSALECFYRGGKYVDMVDIFSKGYPIQLNPDDNAKTKENGIKLLRRYYEEYSSFRNDIKVIESEVLTDFEYEGIEFTVKMDLVYENIRFGGIYGMDHKTTSKSLGAYYFNKFNPSHQIDIYSLYMREKFGDASGIYIDAMQFGFRKRAYKGEPAGFHCKLDRELFDRNNEQIDQFIDDVKYWKDKMIEDENRGVFGRDTSTCSWCDYNNVCSSGWIWELDEELIMQQYKKVEIK